MVINDDSEKGSNSEYFLKDIVTGISYRMIWTVLKTDQGHVALLADNFFKKILDGKLS